MATYKHIDFSLREGIATVLLNRPEKGNPNALSSQAFALQYSFFLPFCANRLDTCLRRATVTLRRQSRNGFLDQSQESGVASTGLELAR